MMKIKFPILFIALLALVALTGCKGDDATDPTSANKRALGTSAEEMLSNAHFKSMTVEIAYPEGFRPQQTTLNNLNSFLQERVNKPSGITIIESVVPAISGNSITIEQVRDFEDNHRTIYNAGDEIGVFIYFSNASSSNDTETKIALGTAYRNTSIVIYDRTLRDISTSSNFTLEELQSTTLLHEFGHLFGLVNIQGDDIHQVHEDGANSKHCKITTCLMYFETLVNRDYLPKMLAEMSGVNSLDPLCIEDLRAKGGK